MRDPERIAKVLHLIYRIWKKYPDMRLMQIIFGALDKEEDLFNLEDEELLIKLKDKYGDKV